MRQLFLVSTNRSWCRSCRAGNQATMKTVSLFAPVVAACKSHSSDIVECQGEATALKRAVAEGGVETHTFFQTPVDPASRHMLVSSLVKCSICPHQFSVFFVCAPDHTSNAFAFGSSVVLRKEHTHTRDCWIHFNNLDCSSDTHCTRSEFGRVTYWLQTLRSWRRWTHRKFTRKDSMRKR